MSHRAENIIDVLRRQINQMSGIRQPLAAQPGGLSFMAGHFPQGSFPLAAMHEFLFSSPETLASSAGFVCGILSQCLAAQGAIVWLSRLQQVFPPALCQFGLQPHHVLFVNSSNHKNLLWATEEVLKCSSVSAVIIEADGIGFTESRRFQLAVERSGVTGFILCAQNKTSNNSCFSRWQVSPLSTQAQHSLPGVGHPRWRVHLQKIRNGRPGQWDVEWVQQQFKLVKEPGILLQKIPQRQTG